VTAPRTARARVRAQLTAEIVDVARAHLATSGAAALSLRAVARELGMVSSAVYRYFPSRDDLLTALIVEGYDALGAAVESAAASAAAGASAGTAASAGSAGSAAGASPSAAGLLDRWHAACAAAREWALAHPHEYALLYGSPVPGYAAPPDTVAPAARVALVLAGIVAEGLAAGTVTPPPGDDDTVVVPGVLPDLGLPADTGLGSRLVLAWSGLFGAISFELFGHTHGVLADPAAHFHLAAARLAAEVGLAESFH
jgi:AcrR family transcriptional regulator